MWLGLRSAGLFLGCWLLLSVLNVRVGVLVDGLLISHYNLISHGGGTSCLCRSRRLSGIDNSSNHKRELVSITAKKGKRREGSTDGNSGKNKVIWCLLLVTAGVFVVVGASPHHFLNYYYCSSHLLLALWSFVFPPPAQRTSVYNFLHCIYSWHISFVDELPI